MFKPRTRRRSVAKKRTHELTVRLAEDELDSVRAAAKAAGLSMADLARQRLLDAGAEVALTAPPRKLRRRDYISADPELVRQVAWIGNNINQIARVLNSSAGGFDAIQTLAQLQAVEQALLFLLPRKEQSDAQISPKAGAGDAHQVS